MKTILENAKTPVLFVCVFLLCSNSWSSQIIIPAAPNLGAKAYLLIDADTGKILVEKNADMPLPPASLTKMMTSYIVANEIEAGRTSNSDMVIREIRT